MKLQWSSKARSDLAGLVEFLAGKNKIAARQHAQMLATAVARLPSMPRIGERLAQFAPREVRRVLVKQYEIRYEIQADTISIARIRHTREDR